MYGYKCDCRWSNICQECVQGVCGGQSENILLEGKLIKFQSHGMKESQDCGISSTFLFIWFALGRDFASVVKLGISYNWGLTVESPLRACVFLGCENILSWIYLLLRHSPIVSTSYLNRLPGKDDGLALQDQEVDGLSTSLSFNGPEYRVLTILSYENLEHIWAEFAHKFERKNLKI
jgi:hypothetical protein